LLRNFALEFFGRKIPRRKINAAETARRRRFVKALAAFAATKYIAVSILRRAAWCLAAAIRPV